MTMRKSFAGGQAQALGPRRVRVQCSSDGIDRTGEVVQQSGIEFPASVPVLWGHDPDLPIGRAYPRMERGALVAEVEFAPEGICEHADRVCGLVKAGVVNTVSIGFDVLKAEPMDRGRPGGPQRYLKSELLELSFVSVPANADAQVTERSRGRGVRVKGLYECARLAGLLSELSWLEECVEAEAAREGDGSPLPEMLGRIMAAMGEALISMTVEEVNELLAIEAAERGAVGRSRKPAAVRFRGAVIARMGGGKAMTPDQIRARQARARLLDLTKPSVADGSGLALDDPGITPAHRAARARARLLDLTERLT
ncbi:HK97 family phage prohead protease [Niveispirillum sp. KHB5.9]|uniref:HK97 family phage prohead protease n=1 Tax=Niveispirillum sp. KHB5.9 TaxID=3400269 RepID=UPI003A849006